MKKSPFKSHVDVQPNCILSNWSVPITPHCDNNEHYGNYHKALSSERGAQRAD